MSLASEFDVKPYQRQFPYWEFPNDKFQWVEKEHIIDSSRWSLTYQAIGKFSDGSYGRFQWEVGATEDQDDTDANLIVVEVFPEQKLVTVYLP